jgi:hypothetical protein
MSVGLSRITSSLLRELRVVLRSSDPTPVSATPGIPPRASRTSRLISPPMATMLPSVTRTTVSVSLTVLFASGSEIDGVPPPKFTTRVLSVTSLIEGWMCRMMLLA